MAMITAVKVEPQEIKIPKIKTEPFYCEYADDQQWDNEDAFKTDNMTVITGVKQEPQILDLVIKKEPEEFDDSTEEFHDPRSEPFEYNENEIIAENELQPVVIEFPRAVKDKSQILDMNTTNRKPVNDGDSLGQQESKKKRKEYNCNICPAVKHSLSAYEKHYLKEHKHIRLYSCSLCNKSFYRRKYLNKHKIVHTSDALECTICKKLFERDSQLQKHILTHNKRYNCSVCKKRFINKEACTKHENVHFKIKTTTLCRTCEKSILSPEELMKHKKNEHCVEELYICEKCPKMLKSSKGYRAHLVTHDENEEMHSYDLCDTSFSGEVSRNYHTHFAAEQNICDVCGKKLTRTRDLEYHVNTHSGVKPYSCEICKKSFYNKYYIDRHMRLHNAGNSRVKTSLEHHSLKQNENTNFRCDLCGVSYNTSVKMQNHKCFSCRVCEKYFPSQVKLAKHRKRQYH